MRLARGQWVRREFRWLLCVQSYQVKGGDNAVRRKRQRYNDDSMDQRIDLAPNCSLSDRSASLFYGSICAFSLPLSAFFAWQGFWPVLLFWCIEMLGLGVALQAALRRRHYSQTVLVTEGSVQLVTRSPQGEARQEFARHWARVKLRSWQSGHRPSRLTIESHGRAGVIGSFLTDDERAQLAVRLHAMVGGTNNTPPLDADFNEGN